MGPRNFKKKISVDVLIKCYESVRMSMTGRNARSGSDCELYYCYKDLRNNFRLDIVIITFAIRKNSFLIFAQCHARCSGHKSRGIIFMDRSRIKVVKRSDVEAKKPKKGRKASPRVAAREMVSTVTDWVSDLKNRKTEETKIAFETLFAANRRTSES